MSRTVAELGEFALIERLQRDLPMSQGVVLGVGDDCAVLRMGDRLMLVSSDAVVDGVHFRLDAVPPDAIGWKAAAAAMSDIAAMGGRPLYALVTLTTPGDMEVTVIEGLFAGLGNAIAACGSSVVGGDTVRGPALALDVMVIGSTHGDRFLRRSGSEVGDVIAVTGMPGVSGAGLHAQERGHSARELIDAHYHPIPRIAEGQWLSGQDAVHAALDVSDGIVADAGHLAKASGLGIDLHRAALPIDPRVQAYCSPHGIDPANFALFGGEDYELLLTIHRDYAEQVVDAFRHAFSTPLHVIGEVTERWTGVRIDGKEPDDAGFHHFTPPQA